MFRAAVLCACFSVSLAQAGVLIATHQMDVAGASAGSFELFPFFSLTDAALPGPAGFVSAGPVTLADFANGIERTLTGDFAAASAGLTDAADSLVYFGATFGAGLSQSPILESDVFAGQPGVTGPDLAGFVLTEIRVLGVAYQDGGAGNFEASLFFSFYGQRVPTPGAGAALLLAGVMGARRRSR